MLEEEKKVVDEEVEQEENANGEEFPLDPEEAKKEVLNQIKKNLIDKSGLSEEEADAALEMLEEAQMPVTLSDADFKCGPQELDIRYLNKKNQTQYFFRSLILQGVYLRNISKSLLDITNLLFVVLDTLGVKDIIKASDEVIARVTKEHEKRLKENNKDEVKN